MGYLYPSNSRIRQSKDFVAAFGNKGLTNKWFTVYTYDSNHEFARLGMVVSKRTIPLSVKRNYAKRFIREIFRHNSNDLPSLDIVVRIRRSLTKDSRIEAKEALMHILQKINK